MKESEFIPVHETFTSAAHILEELALLETFLLENSFAVSSVVAYPFIFNKLRLVYCIVFLITEIYSFRLHGRGMLV